MTDGRVTPTAAEFRTLAQEQAVVPVTRRLLADAETPVGVYRKLAGGPGTFLLESAENGRSWSRYSFVGVRSVATLTERAGRAIWLGDPPAGLPTDGVPTDVLAQTVAALASPRRADLPPLAGGLVGFLAYDAVRRFERLPDTCTDDLHVPELAMMLVSDLAVLDHNDGSILLIANAFTGDGDGDDPVAAYAEAVGRLDAMTTALSRPLPPSVSTVDTVGPVEAASALPAGRFAEMVEQCVEAIKAGECFQIVPSQRFEMPTSAPALDVYRVLRATNPSPYMYLLRFAGFDVVGSSPEAHVKVTGRQAMLHPIAGTRWRGATPEEDERLATELLADPKERSEHVMLVDLGRNDLGRVCRPGSIDVVEFMAIERYSHVMHIVSTIVGQLTDGCTALDVLRATFPAGTLSGAPKVRAMEIIDRLEPTRRGLYGGTVGYLDPGGDLDMAIAIRTALLRDGRAYVQAGGGVVADSEPLAEDTESRNKAQAVLQAVARAETMRAAR